MKLAWFISPHGYGHATRSLAVMTALRRLLPGTEYEIYSRAPHHLLAESLDGGFTRHELETDLGLVQRSALEIDHEATLARLDEMLPFDEGQIAELAARVRQSGCQAIACDIAPMGIAVARAAGLPSILVENFTWDWIYAPYARRMPAYKPHIAYLARWFAAVDLHLQTEPICKPDLRFPHAGPAARLTHEPPETIRARLGVGDRKLVLITMGGCGSDLAFTARLTAREDVVFAVPGEVEPEAPNIIGIGDGAFYHPDLVWAADAVIGKLGYSTLAEVAAVGTPFGYIGRADFRESAVLAAYVTHALSAIALAPDSFTGGAFLDDLDRLLELPRGEAPDRDGGAMLAFFIQDFLKTLGMGWK